MKSNPSGIITCYIGLTVVSRQALRRVNTYHDKLCALFGFEKIQKKEVHITLVPPFHSTYEEASRINLGCAVSTLASTSISNTTLFGMHGLEVMKFEGDTIIHFPITAHKRTAEDLEDETDEMLTKTTNFRARVETLRKQITSFGGEIQQPLPEGYTPHITVLAGKNLEHRALEKVIQESKQESPLYFHGTFPTLYAKYKGVGYLDLSDDPNT
jgi:2'-5' RNA ligase